MFLSPYPILQFVISMIKAIFKDDLKMTEDIGEVRFELQKAGKEIWHVYIRR